LDDPDAGRIFEGGPADFFLVHGDPLTDPTALWRVWRGAWVTKTRTGPGGRAEGRGAATPPSIAGTRRASFARRRGGRPSHAAGWSFAVGRAAVVLLAS